MKNLGPFTQALMIKKAGDAAATVPALGVGRPSGYKNYPRETLHRPANGVYSVVAGDNPSKVYTRFGVSENRFYEANPGLRDIPANKWKAGMKVNIPVSDRLHIMRTKGFDPERTTPLTDEWRNKQIMGESSFNRYAVHPKSNATGAFQILQNTLDQAKQWDPNIKDWTLQDMTDPEKAGYVHDLILRGRQVEWQYKNQKPATQETLVKLWNMPYPKTQDQIRQNDTYLEHIRKQDLNDPTTRKAMENFNKK